MTAYGADWSQHDLLASYEPCTQYATCFRAIFVSYPVPMISSRGERNGGRKDVACGDNEREAKHL